MVNYNKGLSQVKENCSGNFSFINVFQPLEQKTYQSRIARMFFRHPDCDLCKISYLCKKANKCLLMCFFFSIIFDKTGNTDIGG